jgi:hypothetical protein
LPAATWKPDFQDFSLVYLALVGRFGGPLRRLPNGPESGISSGSQHALYSARDNRFMPRITLHYPEFTGMGVTSADAT